MKNDVNAHKDFFLVKFVNEIVSMQFVKEGFKFKTKQNKNFLSLFSHIVHLYSLYLMVTHRSISC